MPRVYLLANLVIPEYKREGSSTWTGGPIRSAMRRARRNYPLASFPAEGLAFWVVYAGSGDAHIMIRARDRRTAYEGARAIQGTLALMFGDEPRPHDDRFSLLELNHVPNSSWTRSRLCSELRAADPSLTDPLAENLSSGMGLDLHRLQVLLTYLPQMLTDHRVSGAMRELTLSRTLFYGFMVGSFYSSHYVQERRILRKRDLEKRYFEYQEKYDLAFLSAFRALERFLGVGQMKKMSIASLLDALPYPAIRSTTRYRRFHEIFSGAARWATYKEMIEHFLDIRNVAAAHANPKPPLPLVVSEDSIYEIQHFIQELCLAALPEERLVPVPKRAFAD